MAKSYSITKMLSALVFCVLLVLAGRWLVGTRLYDDSVQSAEPRPPVQHSGDIAQTYANTASSHLGYSSSGPILPAASLPPAKSPHAQQHWAMTLTELLNFGRDLALAGNQHSLQQLVGQALIRHIKKNPQRAVDNVMALLARDIGCFRRSQF